MMLLDKGYFDYDAEKVEAKPDVVNWERTIKTEEEVNNILSIFGMNAKRTHKTEDKRQEFIINEEEIKDGSRNSGSN